MPSTIDLRRRIRSVKNTQQITKAMKMVSAAKLRRAQERIFSARPYAAALREVLASVAARIGAENHPLLQAREQEQNVVVIVVTSDRGLAGAFNTNANRAALNFIRDKNFASVELIPIGRKANDYFRRRSIKLRRAATQAQQALSLDTAREIATSLITAFTNGELDAVYVVYNEFRSIISQVVRTERLLPLQGTWGEEQQGENTIDYLYEPAPEKILSELLPKYVEFELYRILLESAAAEQGARMTAMEAATKNASDMISHLTLTYNRIRQAAITKEIIEIVSGAAAAGQ
ncbi:MAG TPA: ATP synthase F1 subunit gamma [Thermoanaerobaculia bacterium]|jgi:F-type H+-transporting ATPase subunit gamma|nr:ATP synthase F1 subunit gamma [Thermoanaerobaculia bacterium]